MIAEIISVGTEILMGQILNTNAQFLAQQMGTLGVSLYHQSSVGDNMGRLMQSLEEALSRSDVVLLSGGLGPTEDDMTKWAVANVLGVNMVEDEASRIALMNYFENINIEPTPNNFRQILFPENAMILENGHGTAPGCICHTKDGKAIVVLPGPPGELQPMFKKHVLPYLKEQNVNCIESVMLSVFGQGESYVEHVLQDLLHQDNPTIATYAKLGEVQIRITALCSKDQDVHQLLDPVVNEIKKRLGDVIYSEKGEAMNEVVANLLLEKKKTLAVVESLTGGMICSSLVDIIGSSQFLLEGIVAYSDEAKERLGVNKQLIEAETAVSASVACEMAKIMRERTGADYAVATTGVAGPGVDKDGNPEGLYYVAIADSMGEKSFEFEQKGARMRVRKIAYLNTLNSLRKALLA